MTSPTFRRLGMPAPSMLIAILLVGVIIIGTAATTLGIGNAIRERRTPVAPALTVSVRRQTLRRTVAGTLHAIPHARVTVPANGTVTRNGLPAGATVEEGKVIGVVGERPIFLLQGDVPAFRDIGPGASGEDVRQVQDSLRRLGYAITDQTGIYGESTAHAFRQLRRDAGFAFANDRAHGPGNGSSNGSDAIAQSELVFSPMLPMTSESQCGTAGAIASGTLCTLDSVQRQYVASFTSMALQGLQGTQRIEGKSASVDGHPISGTIGGIADTPDTLPTDGENAADAQQPAAYRAFVVAEPVGDPAARSADPSADPPANPSVDPDKTALNQAALDKAAITVEIESSAENALVVEAVAIHGDVSGGDYLRTSDGSDIPVTVGMCLRGVCVVDGDGITEGLDVRIDQEVT